MGVALLVSCSNGADGDSAESGRPTAVTFSPPAVAAPSPRFGVPLPEGAEPHEAASNAGTEAFTVPSPISFGDVNAFYKREMDGRAFRDFAWCGPRVDPASETYLRIWRRPGTNDYLVVGLTSEAPKAPTVISITESSGAAPDACPPE